MTDHQHGPDHQRPRRTAHGPLRLTRRQAEVLCLAAAGQGTGEIARHLGISPRTVEGHVSVARSRAGARTLTELVARCYADGILPADLGNSPPRPPGMITVMADTRQFPVSVKGVAVRGGRVVLLRNHRGEWELPGGKLEHGEDPPECVVREIFDETGWTVTAGPLLDCWQHHIADGQDVVIVTYGCYVTSAGPPAVSGEHPQAGLFTSGEIPGLDMPDGYKRSIAAWFTRLAGGPPVASRRVASEGMEALVHEAVDQDPRHH